MEFRQVLYYDAVYRNNSISKAAQELFVTQQCVSKQISILEKELGVTLFSRSGRGVTLTNDGIEFMPYARQLLSQYDSLLEKISSCNASSFITLTGKLSPAQVITEMQQASLFALSSYTESFPFVLLEAMSCSLPIVAFNTRGGLDMIVCNGENGYLAEDADSFLSSFSALMGDASLRTQMAAKSREFSSRYSASAVEETWYQLIEDLYENSVS